jgi:hypothetical protein
MTDPILAAIDDVLADDTLWRDAMRVPADPAAEELQTARLSEDLEAIGCAPWQIRLAIASRRCFRDKTPMMLADIGIPDD